MRSAFLLIPIVVASCASAQQVLIEAEAFVKQEKATICSWKIMSGLDASGGFYLEAVPDTRVTANDKLIKGENFTDQPGEMAVLSDRVKFPAAGRYFVWVRAYSKGPEDNRIHVGLNGEWPESGKRMQWCEGKNAWTRASKQRTAAQHCGEPGKIWLDVPAACEHIVNFSLREDGFRFD
ncbi:MAG: hypothetical protein FJW36_13905 [Acidobacteria bacterium]|nr:hypothetical protein [Acidobacteriota bacterium]